MKNGGSVERPVRVLPADDHTMFRQGLARVLASYGAMKVVAEVPNGAKALLRVRREEPDVVVMQVQLPLGKMRSLPHLPEVVIVTMFEEPHYVRELTGAGASAYLVKSASTEHLIGAIRAAVFDPNGENVVVGMPRGMLEEAHEGTDGVLPARELEVLLLAARGLSEATVKRHPANAYPKMGVGSWGEAVREALARDWIPIHDLSRDAE